MPNKIRILPDEVANRIAAGEVVERPASVVKELIENAIDADAARVEVEVTAGGRESIRVSDNGCGMTRDDALLALERHATSKISDLKDLRTLRTHGFRGEAIPSVASVCRLTLETCPEGQDEGTRIRVEGGRVRDVGSLGRSRGTTFAVHGLFYNVPARRKFLKGAETEYRHILNTVSAMALARPDIAFVLTHNGRKTLNMLQGGREQRIEALLNLRLRQDAVFLDREIDGIDLWGGIGRPETARKSGADQVLLVNGRWVRHRPVGNAIIDGFGGLLPKGLMVPYCLFLGVDPARLDVNVHPSKRQVRFADEQRIYELVRAAVSDALRRADLVPEFSRPRIPIRLTEFESKTSNPPQISQARETPEEGYAAGPDLEQGGQIDLPLRGAENSDVEGVPAQADSPLDLPARTGAPPAVSIWQLHGRYLLTPSKNGLLLIDQRRAHQRILYERAIHQFVASPGTAQRLLFPLTLDFGMHEMQVVREAMPLLERIGFEIRDFGTNTVVVDAIPVDQKTWGDGQLIRHIIGDLIGQELRTDVPPEFQAGTPTPQEHRLAAVYAWHSSIRSGEALAHSEMASLVSGLFQCEEPLLTPYGKRVWVEWTLEDIDRQMGG